MNPIAQNITEAELADGERIFLAPTGAKNLVAIEGSVLGGWGTLARSKAEAALLATEVFDAGTKTHSKNAIRESLSARGASLSFRDGVDRTFFSASCFPEDVSFILSLIAECLGTATLSAGEIELAKKREIGQCEESLTDTKTQASDALSRLLYAPSHIHYAEPTKTRMQNLEGITRADVVAFQRTLGRKGLVLAITGDIETSKALRSAQKAFGTLVLGTTTEPEPRPNLKENTPKETLVSIKDKANIDTFFGRTLPFTYESPEFLPFTILSSMLGGRGLASGHLMRTIRERDGYTYGIRSQQTGFTKGTQGMFRIWATFSPANFTEAVAATRKEIGIFLKTGITEETLATKKDETIGNYLIGLSTTRGLASALHTIGTEGKPLSHMDEYPSLIRAVSVSELKSLAPLISADTLSLAASGTFAKS